MPMEIAGLFMIVATAKPGVELARVEKAIDEELAKFLDDGPDRGGADSAIKTQYARQVHPRHRTDRRLRRQVRHSRP